MGHRISVIVPVYNVAKYLQCFFDKMLAQTYQDFKMFVVYDASNDNSLEMLRSYECKNQEKVEVLISPKKNGLGAARDFALDNARITGEYVLFLDSDDYPDLNFLERLVNEADAYNADVTICGFRRFEDVTGRVICTDMVNNPEDLVLDLSDCDAIAYMPPAVWNKLYRRKLIDGMRFGSISCAEDLIFLMRVLPKIKSIKYVNEALYNYRIRQGSLSNSLALKDYNEMLEGLKAVRAEYAKNIDESFKYIQILELATFIRCVIGATNRIACNDKKNAEKCVYIAKRSFNESFPELDRNKYLKFLNMIKRGFKGVAIWAVYMMYKMNLFIVFIWIYKFFTQKLKMDVRW